MITKIVEEARKEYLHRGSIADSIHIRGYFSYQRRRKDNGEEGSSKDGTKEGGGS